jgi:hypothetical protein
METLDNIITDLTSIAQDKGYDGPTVDALIYLLANGIYKNNLNAVNAVLEASASRCRLLNSAIQHAMDQGYSVNRGTNQHIIVKNLLPVAKKSVKKYDQALKINGLCLYYAKDYDLEDNAREIEFIVGEEILEEEITVSNSEDQLCLRSKNTNYSQELDIYDSEGNVLEFVEVRRKVLETYYDSEGSKDLYWLLTTPDYGVEFYRYTRNLDRSYVRFNANAVFRIKGVKYTDKTIPLDSIKTIPGFKIRKSMDETINTTISQVGCMPKIDNINDIYLNSLKSDNSDFMIRATEDLDRSILALSGTGLGDVVSKFYATQEGFKEDGTPDTGIMYVAGSLGPVEYDKTQDYSDLFPGLCIYCYHDTDLPNDIVTRIRNDLVPSYYVTDSIFLFNGVARKVNVKVSIIYTSVLNTNDMSNKIYNAYDHILGAYMNPTRIQNLISQDGIEDIKVTLTEDDVEIDEVQCKDWQYMQLEVIITATTSSRILRH